MSQTPTERLNEVIGEDNLPVDFKLKVTPMPHQWKTFDAAMGSDNNRFGDWSTEGCGKTVPLLMVALTYFRWGNKVLILTKRGLFSQLISEWNKYFENSGVIPIRQPKDISEIQPPVLLATHESLRIPRYWREYKKHYDYIIIDEASAIKNGTGWRFQAVEKLMAGRDKGIYIASATPYERDIMDAYSFIKLLIPASYRDFWAFKKRHGVFNDMGGFAKLVGSTGLPRVKHLLFKRGVRFVKEKVWPAIPVPSVAYRYLQLTDSQRPIYEEFEDYDMFENFDTDEIFDASYSPALKYQKMLSAVSNPNKYVEGATSCILEDVEHLAKEIKAQGDKFCVFFLYAETAKYFYEKLKPLGVARVYGDHDESDSFKDDASVCIMLGTYVKAGFGYNFQFSKYLYLVELLPVPGIVSQATNRIVRPGAAGAATIYIPDIPKSIYTKAIKKLKERSVDMQKILDIDGTVLEKVINGR